MGPETVAIITAAAPIVKWGIGAFVAWLAAKHHNATVTAVANAGAQATQAAVDGAVAAAQAGASPKDAVKAGVTAAVPVVLGPPSPQADDGK